MPRARSTPAALALFASLSLAGAASAQLPPPPPPTVPVPAPAAPSPASARPHCVLVAPFENTSDARGAARAATEAAAEALSGTSAAVFPVAQLRGMFKGTWLELPEGVSPSLALELSRALGADAVVYGAVEGRAFGPGARLTLSVRVMALRTRDLLVVASERVEPQGQEKMEAAVKRVARSLVGPALSQLGPGAGCFPPGPIEKVESLASLQTPSTEPNPLIRPPACVPTPSVPAPPPSPRAQLVDDDDDGLRSSVGQPAATGSAKPPEPAAGKPPPGKGAATAKKLSPRQDALAKKLGSGETFVLANVAFKERTPALAVESGVADLAAALKSLPGKRVRIEAFVDKTADAEGDHKLSRDRAEAVLKKLVKLGVAADRIAIEARGGTRPIAPNLTAVGRQKNRRLEVAGQ